MDISIAQIKRFEIKGNFESFVAMICEHSCKEHNGKKPKFVVVCTNVTNLKCISFQMGRTGPVHLVEIVVNDKVFLERTQVGLIEAD